MGILTTATAMELASVATTEELATVALTEATVATLGATGPTEATMAREMLSPRLLPRLRLTPPSARGVRTRGGLLTGAATATATATATSPPTPGATLDPTQSPTGPTVPAATALLTTATTTEKGNIKPMASF